MKDVKVDFNEFNELVNDLLEKQPNKSLKDLMLIRVHTQLAQVYQFQAKH